MYKERQVWPETGANSTQGWNSPWGETILVTYPLVSCALRICSPNELPSIITIIKKSASWNNYPKYILKWVVKMNLYKVVETIQKQPSKVVIRKRWSENMQQIYSKFTTNLQFLCSFIENHISAQVCHCKFTAYFQNTFL